MAKVILLKHNGLIKALQHRSDTLQTYSAPAQRGTATAARAWLIRGRSHQGKQMHGTASGLL